MSADAFFLFVTWLGSLYVLSPAAVLFWLVSRQLNFAGGHLPLLGLIATAITVHLLKLLFRRARPESLELLVPMPGDWSFPSAHSAQAAAFFLALALIAVRTLSPPSAILCACGCLAITSGGRLFSGLSEGALSQRCPGRISAGGDPGHRTPLALSPIARAWQLSLPLLTQRVNHVQ
jgi:branched-subunit amino acid ABC-type transport system permease component